MKDIMRGICDNCKKETLIERFDRKLANGSYLYLCVDCMQEEYKDWQQELNQEREREQYDKEQFHVEWTDLD